MGIPRSTPARAPGPRRRPPDAALARAPGVQYRCVLRLQRVEDAAALLRVLSDLAIPLSYLVVVPSEAREGHAAYVGLGCSHVADLSIRLASQGIRVERGEEWGDGAAAMRSRIIRCEAAAGATPTQRSRP